MNKLTDSFLDILTSKERMFYLQYRCGISDNMSEGPKRIMSSIITKKMKWICDRGFVRKAARDTALAAGLRDKKSHAYIDSILYKAWVWGQTH